MNGYRHPKSSAELEALFPAMLDHAFKGEIRGIRLARKSRLR